MRRQKILLFWLVLTSSAMRENCLRAADREQREYVIYINGKEAGQSTLTIHQQDDGLTCTTASLSVKFQQLVFNYTLAVEAAEWWRDGKLVALKSVANENGKKTEIVITSEGKDNQPRARINGQERLLAAETWTSSFWKLADAKFHNKSLPVFEVDSGKEYQAQLQFVGAEQLTFLNLPRNSYHFRVTGGTAPVDLWFDQYHRLVRQEFVEQGQKTIVQLVNVRR